MTTTKETYPWSFITTQNSWFKHDYDKWNISMIIHLNQVFCVVMNDHGFVSFVVVMVEPSILCGNEWSWICFLCRSHGWTKYSVWMLGSTMTTTNGTYPWSFITTQNTWFNYDLDKRNISMIIHYHTEYLVQLLVEPSILCGNEWSWICFVCRSYVWTKYSVW
jgi:hypothetical protein